VFLAMSADATDSYSGVIARAYHADGVSK
jgi:hypothetical protein